ncbi:MAG: hypothetical protein A2Y94_05085 [Caldithrix sp. RBG_13_44_9]|nr:MAG: hypothetical protein A2Y94_05085 [Caldithrix sp. RBG_13_44_9]
MMVFPVSSAFILRKMIHLGSGLFLIFFAQKSFWYFLLFGILVLFTIILDLGRNFNSAWNRIFLRFFGQMLKDSERHGKWLGATSLWLGLFLSFIIFPLNNFKIAASVAVLADAIAAIGGKLAPYHYIRNSKTFVGSLLFVITAILLFGQYWNIPLLPTVLMSIILALIELYSPEVIENINITIGNSLLIYFYLFLSS